MSSAIKILYLGDIFGEPGREIIRRLLPRLREQYQLDLILANCENAARGRGISSKLVKELLDLGIDFMTSGNHILYVDEVYACLNKPNSKVIRPYNFPPQAPGRGYGVVESRSGIKVGLINIMGSIFIGGAVGLPFEAADDAIDRLKDEAEILILDMHAEATSEKRAMGWHVDGRVQLMVGTHTHVQTADEEILPNGTAYISDIGMCGPYDSVIGIEKEVALKRMRSGLPQKFEVAKSNIRLTGVVCEVDVYNKRAVKIERVCERL